MVASAESVALGAWPDGAVAQRCIHPLRIDIAAVSKTRLAGDVREGLTRHIHVPFRPVRSHGRSTARGSATRIPVSPPSERLRRPHRQSCRCVEPEGSHQVLPLRQKRKTPLAGRCAFLAERESAIESS